MDKNYRASKELKIKRAKTTIIKVIFTDRLFLELEVFAVKLICKIWNQFYMHKKLCKMLKYCSFKQKTFIKTQESLKATLDMTSNLGGYPEWEV